MNHSAIAWAEEMRSSVSFAHSTSDRKQCVVCPKPRRLAFINTTLVDPAGARSRRCYYNYQAELPDSNAGNEVLDIILSKGAEGSSNKVSSSSPFFCGSPPSRVSNPLIQDAQFRDSKLPAPVSVFPPNPTSLSGSGSASSPNSASTSKGSGYVRVSFGENPAVRIEGFDCLDMVCSIPALA